MRTRFRLAIIIAFYFFSTGSLLLAKTTLKSEYIDEKTQKISITVPLKKNDFVLKDSIDISIDTPNITLSTLNIDQQPVERYEKTFKETKKLFDKSFNITLDAKIKNLSDKQKKVNLYLSYYQGSKKKTVQDILPLNIEYQSKKTEPQFSKPYDKIETVIPTIEKSTSKKESTTFSSRLSDLVAKTETLWIRILLVMLLGLLMSLTPCIYPMIPITLGILQARGSKSVGYNFLQSLCYTSGIATTFAILGLIAAFTGQLFGSIMSNPFFIVALAILLAYLGLSMFGFYEMYTPKFMSSSSNSGTKKGSLLSIFLFGIMSGSVASPCLSPGLILLLSIVTALGSKLLGFILLFAFGFGLGIPLLIIGTFSSSLNTLPRAGMWMIEVKKIFGFMLFGMVFYFLSSIMPLSIVLTSATIFMLAAGIYYFYNIESYDSKSVKIIKNTIGIICIVTSVFLGAKAYKAFFFKQEQSADTFWLHNPKQATSIAKKEKKYLFIDIGAPFCSICKAIDRTLLSDSTVRATLNKFVNLKLDEASCTKDTFSNLCQKYEVVGYPTFLLIEPNTGDLITRWGSELYDLSPKEFIQILKKY